LLKLILVVCLYLLKFFLGLSPNFVNFLLNALLIVGQLILIEEVTEAGLGFKFVILPLLLATVVLEFLDQFVV